MPRPRPALAGCGPGLGRAPLQAQHEIGSALAREVQAERWTRLDAAIRMIDLRLDDPGVDDPQARRLAVGRLQKLERMGLATAAGPAQ
jgi:hypothetical protein